MTCRLGRSIGFGQAHAGEPSLGDKRVKMEPGGTEQARVRLFWGQGRRGLRGAQNAEHRPAHCYGPAPSWIDYSIRRIAAARCKARFFAGFGFVVEEWGRLVEPVCEAGELANPFQPRQISAMSAAEIMKELPKLTDAERREVARKLAELYADEEVEFCNQAALQSFQELEKQDDAAAYRKAR